MFAIEDADPVPGSVMVRRGHGAVYDLALSQDGKRLAGASSAGVFSYRLDSLEGVSTASVDGMIGDVAFSPDGEVLVAGWKGQRVVIWDASSGEERLVLEGHSGPVTSVAWSPDGMLLASGSEDETVIVWDALTGEEVKVLQGYTGAVRGLGWSPEGRVVISSSWHDLIVWDLHAEGVDSAQDFYGFVESLQVDISWSPQLDVVARLLEDGNLEVYFAESSGLDWRWPEPHQLVFDDTSVIRQMAWSADGFKLASGSQDGKVLVWDGRFGILLEKRRGTGSPVSSIAWSGNGDLLATGSEEGTVTVWETDSCAVPMAQGGLARAREALVAYYDALVSGNEAEAAAHFGLISSPGPFNESWTTEGADGKHLPGGLCFTFACLPLKGVLEAKQVTPILYEFTFELDDPEGTNGAFQHSNSVMMDCQGEFRVVGFPPYFP
jgi:WD40 repeat protein